MKRTALVTVGVIAIVGSGSWTAAEAHRAPVTNVTASVSCGTNTSASVIVTPVDANDVATGAPLTVGCGQFGPNSASESVTAGTTQWNFSGFFYPIGATTTTPLLGRTNLGKTVRASVKGAKITLSLVAS